MPLKNTYKVIVSGDGGVGKTTLINQLVNKNQEVKMTPGLNLENLELKLENDIKVDLILWDLGGQPQFRDFQDRFYGDAIIVLLVFDLTRYTSFQNIENEWIPMILKDKDLHDCAKILIGNKVDLEQKIKEEYIQTFKKKHNLPYLTTSAKEAINIDHLKNLLCKMISSCKE
ncbi:MAG: hypothetical protein BAJALOKI1v1_40039 [Promethearchaeota archaeon]|nr:MAG: hypothetical protein BAJALOKI1v1_40039 [Candidatus Lokiarchaeota archaeon]